MEVEDFFQGSALNAVDAKGRLSVPAPIRQVIERRGGDSVVILGPHPQLDCLVGYDTQYANKLWRDSDALRETEAGSGVAPLVALDRDSGLFGRTLPVPYDGSGRIILPNRLKKRGQIDDLALFVGFGGFFTMWNPRVALECPLRSVRESAEDLLEEREGRS